MSAPSPKRARVDDGASAPSAKQSLLAAAAREAEECAARDGPTPAPHVSPADSDDVDSAGSEQEAEAVQQPAAPAAAARRVSSAPALPRPAPPVREPVPRLEAPAWDAGGRDFTVGAPAVPRNAAALALPPLLALLPPGERPLFAPDARGARVPRATRQAALDRLLARALAAAAAYHGEAALMAASGAQQRAALVAQARAAEEALYARSASKLVYSNLAAQALRAAAAPPAPAVVVAAPLRSAAEVRALLARCVLVRGEAAVAQWAAVVAARAHSLRLCWTPPFYARRPGEASRVAPTAADAGGDDAALAEPDRIEEQPAVVEALPLQPLLPLPPPPPPRPPPLPLPSDGDADVDELTRALLHEAPARAPPQPRLSALDARIAALSAHTAPPAAADTVTRAGSAVRADVASACRQFLDPLFKAGAISRDDYRSCARAATDKVCARHAGAPDASFLARETPKLHALLREYVKRARTAREGAGAKRATVAGHKDDAAAATDSPARADSPDLVAATIAQR